MQFINDECYSHVVAVIEHDKAAIYEGLDCFVTQEFVKD